MLHDTSRCRSLCNCCSSSQQAKEEWEGESDSDEGMDGDDFGSNVDAHEAAALLTSFQQVAGAAAAAYSSGTTAGTAPMEHDTKEEDEEQWQQQEWQQQLHWEQWQQQQQEQQQRQQDANELEENIAAEYHFENWCEPESTVSCLPASTAAAAAAAAAGFGQHGSSAGSSKSSSSGTGHIAPHSTSVHQGEGGCLQPPACLPDPAAHYSQVLAAAALAAASSRNTSPEFVQPPPPTAPSGVANSGAAAAAAVVAALLGSGGLEEAAACSAAGTLLGTGVVGCAAVEAASLMAALTEYAAAAAAAGASVPAADATGSQDAPMCVDAGVAGQKTALKAAAPLSKAASCTDEVPDLPAAAAAGTVVTADAALVVPESTGVSNAAVSSERGLSRSVVPHRQVSAVQAETHSSIGSTTAAIQAGTSSGATGGITAAVQAGTNSTIGSTTAAEAAAAVPAGGVGPHGPVPAEIARALDGSNATAATAALVPVVAPHQHLLQWLSSQLVSCV